MRPKSAAAQPAAKPDPNVQRKAILVTEPTEASSLARVVKIQKKQVGAAAKRKSDSAQKLEGLQVVQTLMRMYRQGVPAEEATKLIKQGGSDAKTAPKKRK